MRRLSFFFIYHSREKKKIQFFFLFKDYTDLKKMNTIDILSIHEIICREHTKDNLSSCAISELCSDESWEDLYQQICQNNTSEDVLTDVKAKFKQDEKKNLITLTFIL